jgi:hypothetical protein
MSYTIEQYQTERAICDAAYNYARETMAKRGKRCSYLTADECKNPVYAACNNDMRGRVEQFEILRDMPEKFCAYLENGKPDSIGARLNVTVWTGGKLGVATVYTVAKRGNMYGEKQRYGRAIINGQTYRWQGQGAGMYATFRKIKGN